MSIVLVTGGSGFIGSHVVDKLLSEGHQVITYDLESKRYDQICPHIKGDILDLNRLTAACRGVDFIFNLAAEANVNRFLESPLYSNNVTSQGLLCVLEAAIKCKAKRVLQASTEWIYGSTDSADSSQVDEDTPYAQNPDHLYTCSKIAAELLMKTYCRIFGVDHTIMRYGIPFGERARSETVTPTFIRKICRDEEITVHGDGSQTRQFIYVKQLAAGNVACLQEAARNQIFNLNGQRQISVLEVVRTLERTLNKKAKLRLVPDRLGNFKGRFISSQKAERLLGWKADLCYDAAIASYVDWFIKNERI